jgi:uncharacterized protein YkwD/uncharacterized protein YraI
MNYQPTKLKTISAGILMATVAGGFCALPASAQTPSFAGQVSTPMQMAPMSTQNDAFAREVFDLMNQERAKVGSGPMAWNQDIANVSQDWADQTATKTMNGTFDWATIHRADAGGSLIPQGYTWYRENIGFNFTPRQIVDWWLGSPGHRAAMLDPKANNVGVGYAIPSSGPYAGWKLVVTNLAQYPGAAPAPAPAPVTEPIVSMPVSDYKTTIGLNLRSGPSTSNSIIGSGAIGTTVTGTGRRSGIWYEVRMGNLTGWMSSDYLETVAPPAPAAPTITSIPVADYTTTIGLNLRSGPGLENSIIGAGAIGTKVTGTGRASGIWYEVKLGTQTGWMSSEYLVKVVAPTPPPAPKSPIAIKAESYKGSLGSATSAEIGGLKDGGSYQCFQVGCILHSPKTGARLTMGAIRGAWADSGFENGRLGYPTTDEITGLKDGGVYQRYQGGLIYYTPATGAVITEYGRIRDLWLYNKDVNGKLGYPTSNVKTGLKDGGSSQTFQGGEIFYSPKTGAKVISGGIGSVWKGSGGPNSVIGYPITNEVPGLKNGGVTQRFQNGSIVWSPATGGFISKGQIRVKWLAIGAYNSRMGYPTSNEYSAGAGVTAQNFQGGVIKYSTATGAVVTYK